MRKFFSSKGFLLTVFVYVVFLICRCAGFLDLYFQEILNLALINVILVVSLNVATGFVGQLTLAHSGFMAIGAYLSVLATRYLTFWGDFRFVIALIVAGLFSALLAFLVSIPAMRVPKSFLLVVTLGFNEIIRNLIINLAGSSGIRGIPYYSNFYVIFFVAVLVIFLVYLLLNSKYGMACICISQDEKLAKSCGINSFYYKIAVFVFAAFFAGVSGGLYAHAVTIILPDMFTYEYSLELLAMVVIGGLGNLPGSVFAALVLTFAQYYFGFVRECKFILYMLIMIIVLVFDPRGIVFLIKSMFSRRKKIKNNKNEQGEKIDIA